MADATLLIETELSPTMRNALLESTLVHARNLIELLRGGGGPRSINPHELAGRWQLNADEKKYLGALKRAIDDHLSHLGWARTEAASPTWPYPLVVRDVLTRLDGFVTAVEATRPDAAIILRCTLDQAVNSASVAVESPSNAGVLVSTTNGTLNQLEVGGWTDPPTIRLGPR